MVVLNEEQVMLKDMAEGWVADRLPVTAYRTLFGGEFPLGHDPAAYAEMAEMGWTGIIIPEAYGGSDFGYLSIGKVLEQLGRTLAASPLISSALVAASALRVAGREDQKARWLPAIADGSIIATLAVDEGTRHAPDAMALKTKASKSGWTLNGIKRPVPDGMAASLFIVAARTAEQPGSAEGITLFLVEADAAGLERRPLDQIDARNPALLTFDGVEVESNAVLGAVDKGAGLLDLLLDYGRTGLAAEMLGAATQAFETTLEYLKTRVQFGQTIGSFQALQHRAAEMFAELELLGSAVEKALSAIDTQGPALPSHASLAKALAGETFLHIANEMIQMHGGIGMTHEHDAGLYLKRARVSDQYFGNAAFHRERWGRLNGF